MRSFFIVLALTSLSATGCNNGPGRIAAPKLDAEEITNRVLQEFDKNSDSVVDKDELKEAPSLSYSLKALDKNENGNLEREEILERFQTYVQLKVGLQRQEILFKKKGRPVANAKIELVPAPFMEGLIEPARGETGPSGFALVKADNQSAPAARIGFYRVKVTSDKDKIDAKFNTNTTLGIEIAPVTDGLDTDVVVNLK